MQQAALYRRETAGWVGCEIIAVMFVFVVIAFCCLSA